MEEKWAENCVYCWKNFCGFWVLIMELRTRARRQLARASARMAEWEEAKAVRELVAVAPPPAATTEPQNSPHPSPSAVGLFITLYMH